MHQTNTCVSIGDLKKVVDLQSRVAEAEHDGLSVGALGGALEQLDNYAAALADVEAAADEAEASTKSVEADKAEAAAAFVDEDTILDIDMRRWYVEPKCADALARLHAELIYSRPASTSPKMELVLAFDEMLANREKLFVKTMTTSLRQQALHLQNVEKASRGTKVSRAPVRVGYVVPVGTREFFFGCLTEAEVIKLFDAVRQVCPAVYRLLTLPCCRLLTQRLASRQVAWIAHMMNSRVSCCVGVSGRMARSRSCGAADTSFKTATKGSRNGPGNAWVQDCVCQAAGV
eukprot:COSAG02_NODE_2057_length_9978_cov_8.030874_5_plen_289_part_00